MTRIRQSPPIRRAERLGLDVELRAIRNVGWRFPPHWHNDLQIIQTLRGDGRVWCEGQDLALPPGALFVVPPQRVHTAWAADGEWTFLSLHTSPSGAEEAPTRWTPLFALPGHSIATAFQRVTTALFDRVDEDPALLLNTLLELIRSHRRPAEVQEDELMTRTRLALSEKLRQRIDLAELARSEGLTARAIARRFRSTFYISPSAWRKITRIEAAKAEMRAGSNVRNAAAASGFNDLRHFSRTYREVTGITARAYAARFRRAKPDH